ncbi:PREDICTED: protein HESO1 isoform X2 [Nelumbo nucifera]|uniref:Protein HESO1 isoform X2 n=1 Tax=Nelumbo nucifera TaxID=4432 RepID=A0A1U8AK06_NELNU|nr:PREDICTED: protein HESO1 isoform X2 [Nelumbo nucifera]
MLEMSTPHVQYHALEIVLKDILSATKPRQEDCAIRVHIINEFRAVVESVESLRGTTVEPFGSFVSNLYTRRGDLDISVEVPNDSLVSAAGRRHKQDILKDIRKALRKRGGIHNLQFIPNARVPILKFESNRQNITCDISISNILGRTKSKLLLWISEIDERFRDMVLLVKEWAMAQNINDSKSGTLNSYSLCLLVIFHFQNCRPAIVPPLKEIYPGNIADDLTGVGDIVEGNIRDACAANISRFREKLKLNNSSLSELFVSFVNEFSRINLIASEYAICTYTGQWEEITSNSKWMAKKYPLLIEDPFEHQENTARAVGASQLIRISEAFMTTHHMLTSYTADRSSLVSTLFRPQILSQLVARTPRGVPSTAGRGRHRLNQSLSASIPSRNQTQFLALGNRTSTSYSQRRGPVVNSQAQQEWRPRYSER